MTLAELALDNVPWEVEPETGDRFVSVPEVCGEFWWAQLHSWAENIRDHGCSTCGDVAVPMAMAFHDLVNYKLGKPIQYPGIFEAIAMDFDLAQKGHILIEAEKDSLAAQRQGYAWGDWVAQVAALQRCAAVGEQPLDMLVTGEAISGEQAQELQEWLTCLEDEAFVLPVADALASARGELQYALNPETDEEREKLALYEDLLDEHQADPCTRFIWLAKRTGRYRDRPTLTLTQWRKLTGKSHPGKVNMKPGNLIPWEIAVDEPADALGKTTDEFERCILAAYDRQFVLFELLEFILEREKSHAASQNQTRQNGTQEGSPVLQPDDAGLLSVRSQLHGSQGQALLPANGGEIRRPLFVAGEQAEPRFLEPDTLLVDLCGPEAQFVTEVLADREHMSPFVLDHLGGIEELLEELDRQEAEYATA